MRTVSNETLFSQVSEVAVARIAGPVVTITQVAGGYDPKRSHGGKGTALGASQCVFAIAGVMDNFALASSRQIEAAREYGRANPEGRVRHCNRVGRNP
jgi:hypothetical protein